MDPTPGAYNAINVINKDLNITPQPVKYWTSSTTNWALLTDADLGLMWFWRRKPKSNTWVTRTRR
jgi:hypothetical protein